MPKGSFLSIAETSRGKYLAYLRDILAHAEYLLEVIMSRPKIAVEFGCGTGFHGCFISKFIRHLVCLDLNTAILVAAKANVKNFGIKRKIDFIVADAFHLPFRSLSFDVSFSQGLLEHFAKNDVKKLMRQVATCTRQLIVVSIPSHNYPKCDLGNEKLLSLKEWAIVLSDFRPKLRYYVLDLQSFKNSFLSLKFPRPWHILVKMRPQTY
jgi:SAM-dependent methyltransferase